MERFFLGFEKRALQDTRQREDLVTAGTALIPLGTTAHTALKSEKGKDSGKEWLSRLGANMAGRFVVGLPVAAVTGGDYTSTILAAMAGGAGGEVLANRLVHADKYDEEGKLKKKYRG